MNEEAKKRSEARRNFMLEGPLLKVIFVTALPQVIAMLIDSFYNMADTFFVSQLGSAATAAVGVNDALMMMIRAVAMGFGVGSSSYISRSLGAKEDEEASKAAVTTLFTAMAVIFLLFTVLSSFFLSPVVDFLGATPTVKPYSMDYARWIIYSAPITAATVCLSQTLRAEGSTAFAMIGSVSGCIINVALDPVLISYFGLGVAGAAIATGISKVISLIILFYPYYKRKCVILIKPSYFAPSKKIYGEIAKMGIPTMVRTGIMSLSTIVMNNVSAGYGDIALAAVSVSNKSMKFMGSAVLGFGQGFQPIAGYSWGAKKYDRVLKAFKYTTIIGVIIGVTTGAVLAVFAGPVISVFSSEPEVIALGIILVRSQSLVLAPHTWVMIVTGLFQALGKPLQAALTGLSRQLFSLIPCVIIMSYLFGLDGLVRSQAVADVVSFILALCLTLPMVKTLIKLAKEQKALESAAI